MKTINDVTRKPATKPLKTDDGVCTGILITLRESVALADDKPLEIPAGTLITGAICGGHSSRLGSNYAGHQLSTSGTFINYRA